jgi:sugar phosphate isomerase/epimerase
VIEAFEECCDYSGKKGIFLGIENHGGIVAESKTLLEIVRAVKSPWLGINLDSANFHTEDPYHDLELCAPYAINVQLKREIRKKGGKSERADFPRMISILKKANYQGYVVLEYESSEDPFETVPGLLQTLRGLVN